jgi:hypothetical protein
LLIAVRFSLLAVRFSLFLILILILLHHFLIPTIGGQALTDIPTFRPRRGHPCLGREPYWNQKLRRSDPFHYPRTGLFQKIFQFISHLPPIQDRFKLFLKPRSL